jgi:subfamily B ATP-binding cassette protein MsbA
VRKADAVAVIDGGRVVEWGTHRELMRRDGIYRKLNELQFGVKVEQGVLA